MLVKEVLKQYHKKVPFPLSPRKIRAAGYDETDYLKELTREIKSCEDYDGRPLGF